jgi:hypothetical protein
VESAVVPGSAALRPETRALINGKRVDAQFGK